MYAFLAQINCPFHRITGRRYIAKSLQKYILSLAQQVATEQGHPLVISSLVAKLHRRLQNTKGTTEGGPAIEISDEGDDDDEEEEEEEEEAQDDPMGGRLKIKKESGGRRLTRAAAKKKADDRRVSSNIMCS